MELPDLKKLKKLADTCRKSGIKHFKSEGFEFTLTEEAPVSNYKKSKEQSTVYTPSPQTPFETDTLSDDALMFWSTGNPTEDQTLNNGE